MIEAGIEPRERALAEARHKLAAADQTLEEKHGLLRKIDEERKTLVAGGSNPAYGQALETISSADSKDDLAQLYGEARRTPTSADDAIVRRLEAIDAQCCQGGRGGRQPAPLGPGPRTPAPEVQDVRDRFRGAGYDHPNATFGNDGDIADVLGRVLAGAANSGVLWDLLRGGYRYRQPRGRPDFGAPNFPFPFPIPGGGTNSSTGGGWREPSSRGGWSPREDYPDRSGGGDDLHHRRIVLGLIHAVLRLLPKIGVADELIEGAIGGTDISSQITGMNSGRQRQAAPPAAPYAERADKDRGDVARSQIDAGDGPENRAGHRIGRREQFTQQDVVGQ